MTNWIAAAINALSHEGRDSNDFDDTVHVLKLLLSEDYYSVSRTDTPMRHINNDLELVDFPDDPRWILVRAIFWSMLTGYSDRGVQDLLRLHADRSNDPELRAAASIFTAMAKSSESENIESASLCVDTVQELGTSLSAVARTALLLQACVKYCEIAKYSDASEILRQARQAAGEMSLADEISEDESAAATVLLDSVEVNIVELDRLSREANVTVFRTAFPEEKSHLWAKHDRRVSSALRGYMEETFSRQVRDATAIRRTSTLGGGDDPIARNLHSYVVMCELSGHLRRLRDANGLLARERLLRKTDPVDWGKEQGLSLMRKSGDGKALEWALNHVRAEGPMSAIRSQLVNVVNGLSGSLRRVDLQVLRTGAICADTDSAERALDYLFDFAATPFSRDVQGSFRPSDVVWRTVVPLISRTSVNYRATIASKMLEAARDGGPLVHVRLGAASDEIDWATVEPRVVADWIDWCISPSPGGDADNLAVRVLADLVRSRREDRAIEALAEKWQSGGDQSLLAGAFVDLVAHGIDSLASRFGIHIHNLAAAYLQSTREQAAGGMHSFGSIDSALLAVKLSALLPAYSLWPEVVDFVADPAVFTSEKERAFDYMARHHELIPPDVKRDLVVRVTLPSGITDVVDFFDAGNNSSLLRFLCGINAIDGARASAAFLELSGSRVNSNRADAAISAPFVSSSVSPELALGVVLQLSQDDAVVVRTSAVRQLPYFYGKVSRELDELIEVKVREHLERDGLSEPLAVLRGFMDMDVELRSALAGAVVSSLETMGQESVAYILREGAHKVLDSVRDL